MKWCFGLLCFRIMAKCLITWLNGWKKKRMTNVKDKYEQKVLDLRWSNCRRRIIITCWPGTHSFFKIWFLNYISVLFSVDSEVRILMTRFFYKLSWTTLVGWQWIENHDEEPIGRVGYFLVWMLSGYIRVQGRGVVTDESGNAAPV